MVTSGPRRPGPTSPRTGPAPAPSAAEPAHWFEPLADHLGAAYERYSFTRGTEQEVAFLVEALGLAPDDRILDIGCGTGRHARALGARGLQAVGLDVAARFLAVARDRRPDGEWVRGDARRLPFASDRFDAVLSLCQGGFGLTGGPAAAGTAAGLEPDEVVLREVVRVLRPGGQVALTAFASYFAVRDLGPDESFAADSGVLHERTTLLDEQGRPADHDLWTTCYTPRELRLLLRAVGLSVRAIWSVRPGRYEPAAPGIDAPELLAVAAKPR